MTSHRHRTKKLSVQGWQKELEELENHKLQTGGITQDSVDSTRRMLRLVDECQDAGINTLRMLHHQGEILDNTERGLEEMGDHLEDGDKTLKLMERLKNTPCFLLPCFFCCCSKKPRKQAQKAKEVRDASKRPSKSTLSRFKDKSEFSIEDGNNNRIGQPQKSYPNSYSTKSDSPSKVSKSYDKAPLKKQRFFDRITGDSEEDELEKNLDHVSSYVNSLKGQAEEMGETVLRQNEQLDRINDTAQTNQSKLTNVTERTARLNNSDSTTSICFCGIC